MSTKAVIRGVRLSAQKARLVADQIRVVVNRYSKKPGANVATLEQIQQTLNQPVFYGIPQSQAVIAAINQARPFVANREQAGEMDRIFRAFVDKAIGARKTA